MVKKNTSTLLLQTSMVFGHCIKTFIASYRSVEWQAYFHQCGAEADYGQSCNHHADPKPSIQANALERLRKQVK